jgi:WD40 repeat protein
MLKLEVKDHRTISTDGAIMCLAGSNDGSLVAVVSSPTGFMKYTRALIRIWDLDKGKERLSIKTSPVSCLTFSPDGRTLLTAHWDGKIRLWERCTGKVRAELRGHTNVEAKQMTFTPDGKVLVSFGSGYIGGTDPEVKVWDFPRLKEKFSYTSHDMTSISATLSRDGNLIVMGGGKGELLILDVRSRTARKIPKVLPGRILNVQFLSSGDALVVASVEGATAVWDLAASRPRLLRNGVGRPAWRIPLLSDRVMVVERGDKVRFLGPPDGQDYSSFPIGSST